MKLAQLSLALPATALKVGAGSLGRARLGPRRVMPVAGLEADPSYALQELLNAVQAMAQGAFHGEAQVQEAAAILAADLGKLGPAARHLLRPLQYPPGRDLPSGLDFEA